MSLKRLFRNSAVIRMLAFIAAGYIRLVMATSRITRDGFSHIEAAHASGRPAIFAFWHDRLMMMPAVYPEGMPLRLMISRHGDGELIARIVGFFGIGAVRGSTRKGAVSVLRAALTSIRAGEYIGITPDGPRGPRHVAQAGVAEIATRTGSPVIPITYATSRGKTLRSWDRFLVALPFARMRFVIGEPMLPPAPQDKLASEAFRLQIEEALNHLSERADMAIAGEKP